LLVVTAVIVFVKDLDYCCMKTFIAILCHLLNDVIEQG